MILSIPARPLEGSNWGGILRVGPWPNGPPGDLLGGIPGPPGKNLPGGIPGGLPLFPCEILSRILLRASLKDPLLIRSYTLPPGAMPGIMPGPLTLWRGSPMPVNGKADVWEFNDLLNLISGFPPISIRRVDIIPVGS